MKNITIELPDDLLSHAEQVAHRMGFESAGAYVQRMVRRELQEDVETDSFIDELAAGAASSPEWQEYRAQLGAELKRRRAEGRGRIYRTDELPALAERIMSGAPPAASEGGDARR